MKSRISACALQALAAVMAIATGCDSSVDSFSPVAAGAGNASTGGVAGCTLATTAQNLRILFMVDNSGSTRQTDPNDTHRVDTVQELLTNYGAKPNLTYSYSYFASSVRTYDMVPGGIFENSPSEPFGSAAEAAAALALFRKTGTSDGTDYSAAFSALTALLSADENTGGIDGAVVIFMSDGQPTDLGKSGSSQLNGIKQLTSSLRQAIGSDRLTISSVFFGSSSDSTSVANLQEMAAVGGGQFVNTNVTTDVSIDSLVSIPGSGCAQ